MKNRIFAAATAALLLTTAGAPTFTGGVAHGKTGAAAAPVLATPEQRAAEKHLLTLLADPAIKAAQQAIIADLKKDPGASTTDGAARLTHAVDQWTTSLILRELAADPVRPSIVWTTDNTPHSWFGYTVPGAAVAGDNPDHIYRNSFLQPNGQYEISGTVDLQHRPAQFSFEVTRGTAGKLGLARQTRDHADMGNLLGMITDRDIKVEPDGRFKIIIGGTGGGTNHLPGSTEPFSLNIRDVLSDWTQRPNALTIRRLDATDAKPLSDAVIRKRVLEDISGYVRFWAAFKDSWFGGLQPNSIVGPVQRDGNWGFLAAGRYKLAPDEAVVLKTTHGTARYTGVQVTDPWMVAPSASTFQTSINSAQSTPDADGGYTYVISPVDPGVANWIDTGGLHEGYFLARWQGFDKGAKSDGLLQSFTVAKLADIRSGLTGVPRFDADKRRRQVAEHTAAYSLRTKP
ncbi:hypothetical protein [Novosphingobium sp. BL-52-GroH]|uniref:hypothetical protein n=1 Tax=Novosphingobium sp. BL-52-GroH TaxID=3349877 RepID=UPI00384EDE4D